MTFWREYNTAAIIQGIPLIEAGAQDYQVNPTLAAGDAKISKDGGSFINLATLPVVTPAGGSAIKIELSAGEMQCALATIQFVDAAGAEWEDQTILVETFGNASAQFAPDYDDATDLGLSSLGGPSVTVTSPALTAKTVEVVQGDDYRDNDGRAYEYTLTSPGYDVTGATVAKMAFADRDGTHTLQVTGSVDIGEHGDVAMKFELTAAQTTLFQVGVDRYGFDIQLTLDNGGANERPVTPIRGLCTVYRQYATS